MLQTELRKVQWNNLKMESSDNLTGLHQQFTMGNVTQGTQNNNGSSSNPWLDHDNLTLVLAPVFLLVGGVGNCLSGAVMWRKQFRRMSLGIYLFLLAMADNLTLLSNRLTRDWIRLVTGVNLRTYSHASCSSLVYIMYSASSISSWLIVAVSVERMLVVSLPFKARELSTRRRATFVAGSMIILLLLAHTFIFRIVQLGVYDQTISNQTECIFIPEEQLNGVDAGVLLELFHLCMYSVIPAIFLMSSNIIIIIKLGRSLAFRNSFQKSLNGPPVNNSTVNRTTVMLLVMSNTFVLMTLPLSLLLLQSCIRDIDPPKNVEVILFWLKVVNHAINFLLYSVSGPAFRRELRDMCNCGCSKAYEGTPSEKFNSSRYVVCKSIVVDKSPLHHV